MVKLVVGDGGGSSSFVVIRCYRSVVTGRERERNGRRKAKNRKFLLDNVETAIVIMRVLE